MVRRGFDRISVDPQRCDGKPWELMQEFGLTAEYIAARVLKLRERWQSREEQASAA